jgi:hypothetical protein
MPVDTSAAVDGAPSPVDPAVAVPTRVVLIPPLHVDTVDVVVVPLVDVVTTGTTTLRAGCVGPTPNCCENAAGKTAVKDRPNINVRFVLLITRPSLSCNVIGLTSNR